MGELVRSVIERALALVVAVIMGCGAGNGVGGAVGCAGESMGFFSRSTLYGAYHVQRFWLEAALWRRMGQREWLRRWRCLLDGYSTYVLIWLWSAPLAISKELHNAR